MIKKLLDLFRKKPQKHYPHVAWLRYMDFNKYIELALAIHAAASIIVALTPTPHDDRILGKLIQGHRNPGTCCWQS
jgi:hypothetical protein